MKTLLKISLLFVIILVLSVITIPIMAQEVSIYDHITPKLVSVRTENSIGSGFFVSAKGHIATNYHIINDRRRVSIEDYNGTSYSTSIVAVDKDRDIAILKADVEFTPNINFASPESYKTGDEVFIFGSPKGWSNSMVKGAIMNEQAAVKNGEYIQIQAQVEAGNSGGPVIDKDGNLIGVMTFKDENADAIAFALPSSKLIDQLLKNEILISRSDLDWNLEFAVADGVEDGEKDSYIERFASPIHIVLVIAFILIIFALIYFIFWRNRDDSKAKDDDDFEIEIK